MRIFRGVITGAAAGAAGTTALNAATYLDMAGRGRASSSAPDDAVERLADKTGVTIPGEGETRASRVSGTSRTGEMTVRGLAERLVRADAVLPHPHRVADG